MKEDSTAFARAVQAWAATEMLHKVCRILGVEADDLIAELKAVKRDADAYRRMREKRP